MDGFDFRAALHRGLAIPAHPLALNAARQLDERRQRALSRYYIAAGAGGLAVGVHTTQFAIRHAKVGLFEPVLSLAKEEMDRASHPLVRIAGVCGETRQAITEAELIRGLGYHAGLLSLAAMKHAAPDELIAHCRAVAEVIPVIGFYLQGSVGGGVLSHAFWQRFAEIENVVAIKIAPFNRYQTLDVVRAVMEVGRDDIALYTGNDDNIVADLLTPYRIAGKERRLVGGLLGHWSVWTKCAVALLERCRNAEVTPDLLRLGVEVTDSNAVLFDAANDFRGCIAGLHEVLRRQGLLEGIWCLDEGEGLSRHQREEIDRVCAAYPHLNDDDFVATHRDDWLKP
ncbi:dihydrodipicolinate synthetase [Chthoniobacter flavus Ellin428]|uniref:Dihydrodipicolinate synthetase n=1 Tax=Chthoniobacter flavus Ellin428 TaxID=497964 RepID=B4DAX0_9BACT|nr:dihydrodipicolinate synthase family protein [Chthoniobacter flavus]EDY16442.1 dihydrodipicolinate synthetase [Chthoniobacter flavus Ellin428]TCO84545.1 dihydrodipicolinate synthase/N-acetylneuraminate lyase [Chthoniobacter flavus]